MPHFLLSIVGNKGSGSNKKNELTDGKTHCKLQQAVQISVSEGTVDLCVFLDSYICLTLYTKHNATSKTKRYLTPNDVADTGISD